MNSTLWVPSETRDQKAWKLRKKPIIQVNGCDCSQRVYFGSSYYSDFLWKSPSLNYLVVIVYLSNRHFMLFLHRKGQWVVFWLGSVFWLSDLYVNDLWQQLLYARSLLVDWGSQWALKTSPKWKKFVGWWGTYWALIRAPDCSKLNGQWALIGAQDCKRFVGKLWIKRALLRAPNCNQFDGQSGNESSLLQEDLW